MPLVSSRKASGGTTAIVVAGLAVALALAFFVSPNVSSSPDGLEMVAAQRSIDAGERPHAMADGTLADYTIRGVDDPALSKGLAGVIGVAATFSVATVCFALLRRTARRRVDIGAVPIAGPPS